MTTVAIHQPEYFPWLGYLDKIRRADTFVLLDNVQFDRSSLQQRARVLGAGGPVWLGIPFVHRFPQRIDEVRLADAGWCGKHAKTLQACYGRAAGYADVSARLAPFFARPFERLADATVLSIEILVEAFGLGGRTRILRASELPVAGSKGDLVLAICNHLGASRYLSGRSGAEYLDAAAFRAAGIEIEVQGYEIPDYPRPKPLSAEDRKGLSALDAWFHLGAGAPAVLDNLPETPEKQGQPS